MSDEQRVHRAHPADSAHLSANASGQTKPDQDGATHSAKKVYLCDRCGCEMVERNCKITCPNCGNRFDCSDLNIYFD